MQEINVAPGQGGNFAKSHACISSSQNHIPRHNSFTVDEEFRFLNQTIAQSHLGEKHDSIVVAIERNDELITLDKDTTFQLGDLVWIVGNREKIREILYLT